MSVSPNKFLVGTNINLFLTFKDDDGNNVNFDTTPTIEIIDPKGSTIVSDSATLDSNSRYFYNFQTTVNSLCGTYKAIAIGAYNGLTERRQLTFEVVG